MPVLSASTCRIRGSRLAEAADYRFRFQFFLDYSQPRLLPDLRIRFATAAQTGSWKSFMPAAVGA